MSLFPLVLHLLLTLLQPLCHSFNIPGLLLSQNLCTCCSLFLEHACSNVFMTWSFISFTSLLNTIFSIPGPPYFKSDLPWLRTHTLTLLGFFTIHQTMIKSLNLFCVLSILPRVSTDNCAGWPQARITWEALLVKSYIRAWVHQPGESIHFHAHWAPFSDIYKGSIYPSSGLGLSPLTEEIVLPSHLQTAKPTALNCTAQHNGWAGGGGQN